MAVGTISEHKYNISHAINNRLNALSLGMRVLESETTPEAKQLLNSLRLELKDLQYLIEELKYAD
jgi:signal transduction histidine kinase